CIDEKYLCTGCRFSGLRSWAATSAVLLQMYAAFCISCSILDAFAWHRLGQGIPVPHYGARGTCTGLKGTSAGANVTFWKHNCSRALKDVNIVSADENGPNVIFGATAALSSVPERN